MPIFRLEMQWSKRLFSARKLILAVMLRLISVATSLPCVLGQVVTEELNCTNLISEVSFEL